MLYTQYLKHLSKSVATPSVTQGNTTKNNNDRIVISGKFIKFTALEKFSFGAIIKNKTTILEKNSLEIPNRNVKKKSLSMRS